MRRVGQKLLTGHSRVVYDEMMINMWETIRRGKWFPLSTRLVINHVIIFKWTCYTSEQKCLVKYGDNSYIVQHFTYSKPFTLNSYIFMGNTPKMIIKHLNIILKYLVRFYIKILWQLKSFQSRSTHATRYCSHSLEIYMV